MIKKIIRFVKAWLLGSRMIVCYLCDGKVDRSISTVPADRNSKVTKKLVKND